MKIEVLVSTMYRKDFDLIKKMNIKGDAVIINQTDKDGYAEADTEKGKAKFISTTDRGLSVSRNAAIKAASGEVCLIADDDLRYADDYIEGVKKAYLELPRADIIVFDVLSLNPERPERDFGNRIFKLGFKRALQVSSYRISFRPEKIAEKNITLNPVFGAGARFSMGEENIFMRECLKRGLKAYYYPYRIAEVTHEQSTWFAGYTDKYFRDLGAVYYKLFGGAYLLFALWFLLTKRRLYSTWMKGRKAIGYMREGKREYETVIKAER
ncbi:MAG: glycosyltransferase [Christensenellales bacterium]|jgi:glycosyltransferase involved in cell wall biosynthesis